MHPSVSCSILVAGLLVACGSSSGGPPAPAPSSPGASTSAPAAPAGAGPSAAAAPTTAALPAKANALYSSQNVDSLVFYIADRYGFWAQEGLPLELGYGAANTADAALISGQ